MQLNRGGVELMRFFIPSKECDYKALASLLTQSAEAFSAQQYNKLSLRVLIINVHMKLMQEHLSSSFFVAPPHAETAKKRVLLDAYVKMCFPGFYPRTQEPLYDRTPSALEYGALLLGGWPFMSEFMRNDILMEPAVSGAVSFLQLPIPKLIKHVIIDYVLGRSSNIKISTETMQYYVLCGLQNLRHPLGKAFNKNKFWWNNENSGSRAGVSEKIKSLEEESSEIIEEFLFRVQKETGRAILPNILSFLNIADDFAEKYENNDALKVSLQIKEDCLAEANQYESPTP